EPEGFLLASGGSLAGWAFSEDLVDLKSAWSCERLFRRRVRVRFHERLALGPSLKILFRSPVSHDNIVIALHRPQDLSLDETGRLCNMPFSLNPSPLKILLPAPRDRYPVRHDQDHGER